MKVTTVFQDRSDEDILRVTKQAEEGWDVGNQQGNERQGGVRVNPDCGLGDLGPNYNLGVIPVKVMSQNPGEGQHFTLGIHLNPFPDG